MGAALGVTVVIWASAFAAIRAGLEGYTPGHLALLRFLVGSALLLLYAVAARESWQVEAAQQAYYYVLDDEKVPVDRTVADRDWIEQTVLEVGEGIQSQGFEPTPSWSACSWCDYRLACPAAER